MGDVFELREVAANDGRVAEAGDQIRRAREERQLTQQDVAQALNVSVSTVSNWERGLTSPRSRQGALEKLLGLNQGDLGTASASAGPTLQEATDLELVSEIARRLSMRRTHEPDNAGFSAEELGVEDGPLPPGLLDSPDAIVIDDNGGHGSGIYGMRQSGTDR